MAKHMDVFKGKLEDFAMKHKKKIRANAEFRQHFQEMCNSVGIDPLACMLLLTKCAFFA